MGEDPEKDTIIDVAGENYISPRELLDIALDFILELDTGFADFVTYLEGRD